MVTHAPTALTPSKMFTATGRGTINLVPGWLQVSGLKLLSCDL
jgi:hypothetical protein